MPLSPMWIILASLKEKCRVAFKRSVTIEQMAIADTPGNRRTVSPDEYRRSPYIRQR